VQKGDLVNVNAWFVTHSRAVEELLVEAEFALERLWSLVDL
jgi:hypothetical protein